MEHSEAEDSKDPLFGWYTGIVVQCELNVISDLMKDLGAPATAEQDAHILTKNEDCRKVMPWFNSFCELLTSSSDNDNSVEMNVDAVKFCMNSI